MWRIEDKATVLGIKDHVVVRCRWVISKKGDHRESDMRARLVACELNKECNNDLFHASRARLSFVDMYKAYFNGIPRRDVFMPIPKELGLPAELAARQVK